MSTHRTGGHWGVTIIRQGTQSPDDSGRRSDDRLVAVVMNGAVVSPDLELAERVVMLLNRDEGD